jgi:hypothetical protein
VRIAKCIRICTAKTQRAQRRGKKEEKPILLQKKHFPSCLSLRSSRLCGANSGFSATLITQNQLKGKKHGHAIENRK